MPVTPVLRKQRHIPGGHRLASLDKTTSPRFSGRYCLKKYDEVFKEDTLMSATGLQTCL